MKTSIENGIKHGCLTVIDSDSTESKNCKKYKCQCKCGKIIYLSEENLTRKKWRTCQGFLPSNETCTLDKERILKMMKSYPRIEDKSYQTDYSWSTHESLEVLDCIDDRYEDENGYIIYDKRKKGAGICKVFKLYKCRCYLCNKEFKFKSSDFEIKKDQRGRRAKEGYYCDAHCDCHKISSFQWRTIKILTEHSTPYKVEVSFQNLFGIANENLLRYDFSILNKDGSIKCLIECQGEQHYNPVAEFGGILQYKIQVKNDELKRSYANSRKIPLLEIPYTIDTYEKEVSFLTEHKIL